MGDEEEKVWQCTECGKSFKKYITYYSHRKTHRPPSVVCHHCGNMFNTYAHRNSHIITALFFSLRKSLKKDLVQKTMCNKNFFLFEFAFFEHTRI